METLHEEIISIHKEIMQLEADINEYFSSYVEDQNTSDYEWLCELGEKFYALIYDIDKKLKNKYMSGETMEAIMGLPKLLEDRFHKDSKQILRRVEEILSKFEIKPKKRR